MGAFKFKQGRFVAEQVSRDTVVQLPHLGVLVPSGDWILLAPDGGPVLHLTNAMFREVMKPDDPKAAAQLAAAVPVYVPKPNEATQPAGVSEVPGAGPA